MNEEDPEHDRATQGRRLVPPCYILEADSPLSLYVTVLSPG